LSNNVTARKSRPTGGFFADQPASSPPKPKGYPPPGRFLVTLETTLEKKKTKRKTRSSPCRFLGHDPGSRKWPSHWGSRGSQDSATGVVVGAKKRPHPPGPLWPSKSPVHPPGPPAPSPPNRPETGPPDIFPAWPIKPGGPLSQRPAGDRPPTSRPKAGEKAAACPWVPSSLPMVPFGGSVPRARYTAHQVPPGRPRGPGSKSAGKGGKGNREKNFSPARPCLAQHRFRLSVRPSGRGPLAKRGPPPGLPPLAEASPPPNSGPRCGPSKRGLYLGGPQVLSWETPK